MKNKLTDLNNHLFAQLERLSEEDLDGDALKLELKRTNAITCVAREIIDNGSLILKAQIALTDRVILGAPAMLGLEAPKE